MNLLQQKQHLEYLASQQAKIQAQRDEQQKKQKEFVQGILDTWKAQQK